jgi:hypothetical protein
MSCSFTEQVSYLIDGELPAAESREVERHLLDCPECRHIRADFLNLRSQISSFESSATMEVQRRELARILGRNAAPTWNWAFAPAAAFAVLLLVVAVAGVYYLQQREQRDPNGGIAAASPTPDTKSATVKDSTEGDKTPDKGKVNEPKPDPKESPKPPKRVPTREPKPYEKFAAIPEYQPEIVATADGVRATDPQSMTIQHFEKTETLLRSFRNLRVSKRSVDIAYEKKRAQQLVFQNMMLRREADSSGDVQSAALLESVEPILIDIANLPNKADEGVVRVINERVQRKNIVALLQVNSATLARALD